MNNLNHNSVQAARRRRDQGEAPMPADNPLLASLGEPTNPLPPRVPIEPRPGSRQASVLRMLRSNGHVSIEEIERKLGLDDDKPARAAIDGLRSKAWWITSEGDCCFRLVRWRLAA